MLLQPFRLFLQSVRAELARPHPAHLLRDDQPRVFQHADVLHHAGERDVESLSQVRDRGVRTSELLQHTPSGDIRESRERRVQPRLILYHMVKYTGRRFAAQWATWPR